MSELGEFLRMGGYAAYVWSSYALTLLVIGGILWWSARELRRTREETFGRARTRGGKTRRRTRGDAVTGAAPERLAPQEAMPTDAPSAGAPRGVGP